MPRDLAPAIAGFVRLKKHDLAECRRDRRQRPPLLETRDSNINIIQSEELAKHDKRIGTVKPVYSDPWP